VGDRFPNACAAAGDEDSFTRLIQGRFGGRNGRIRCPVDSGRAVVGHGDLKVVKELREKLLRWEGI
jgi:hypothetical protein